VSHEHTPNKSLGGKPILGMKIIFAVSVLIFASCIATLEAYAQKRKPVARSLGWDLSYSSVLEANRVPRDDFLRQWLTEHPQSPIEKRLLEWRGEPIVSSLLIEKPALSAGERFALWFVRARRKVYFKIFADGHSEDYWVKDIPLKFYDDLFITISSLQPRESSGQTRIRPFGVSGYCGFLSLYDRGKSRQMLLTLEDFYSADELKDRKLEDELGDGRLARSLRPLFRIRW
jgi:hypothetical protein